MARIDVLNLEWTSSPSRDRQMATLVCNYLRFQGYKVYEGSVFQGFYLINKFKPKIFFITNSIGAPENFELVKYAKSLGIVVITLVSEGNFKGEEVEINQFLWGWNKDKVLYEDLQLHWSERTRDLTLALFPELKKKIKVSGGVGFDIYKIDQNKKKGDFLNKYGLNNFDKIIGVGCWDFGAFYQEDHRYSYKLKQFSTEQIERFKIDGKEFNLLLNTVVKENPDILFILKQHPGTLLGYKASAIEGLDKYKNTLILKNEESVFDCISVSDFWLVYESTTALESWLLGKQTCLLNPSGTDFPRDNVFRGSVAFNTYDEVQAAIFDFYKNNNLPGFDELHKFREEIIKNTIQWDDGLNHVRAGNEIIKFLNKKSNQIIKSIPLQNKMKGYKQAFLWFVSKFYKVIPRYKGYFFSKVIRFKKNELKKIIKKRYEQQVGFYSKKQLDIYELNKIECL